ncbi:MAG: YIP1 family protein [Spirochaetia bacterium]|nr:YIP1 family protein [Spirochaetia bacterium]
MNQSDTLSQESAGLKTLLSIDTLRDSTVTIFRALIRPELLAHANDHKKIQQTIVRGVFVILSLLTLLLVVTGILNFNQIQAANENLVGAIRGQVPLYQNPGPLGRLLFPLSFIVVFFFLGAIRNGAMILFGDARSFLTATALSAFALIPFVISGGLQGVVNNLFPLVPSPEVSNVPLIRIYTGLFLTFAAVAWEGFLCIRTFRIVFTLNRGRATLIWLSPLIAGVLSFVLVGMVLQLFFL